MISFRSVLSCSIIIITAFCFVAPIYYKSIQATEQFEIIEVYLGDNRHKFIGEELQNKTEKTLLTDYIYFGIDEDIKESYSGSSDLLPIFDDLPSSSWSIDGTYQTKRFYPEHEEGVLLVYQGGWSFVGQFVGLMLIFAIIGGIIFLCWFFATRKEILDIFHMNRHEFSEEIPLNDKALFKLRCAATIGMLIGKDVDKGFTPKLKYLTKLWQKYYCGGVRIIPKFDFKEDLVIFDQPLSLIITNFIKNAVYHTSKPIIKLTIKQSEKSLYIKVTNYTKEKASLKDQRRVRKKTERSGLLIVRKVLKKMGANPYKFEFLDKETSFWVEIPLNKVIAHKKPTTIIRPRRIAIVDDHPDILSKLENDLIEQNFRVFKYSHIDDLYTDLIKYPERLDAIILDRMGHLYTDRRHWDSVRDNVPKDIKDLEFNGPIILYTVSGEDDKIEGFDRVLAKGMPHDWQTEIGGLL